MNMTFDLETESLKQEDMPFMPEWWNDKVGTPPEFTSRYTTDIEKREKDIAEKQRTWFRDEEQKIIQRRVEFMDSAALSPDFGRIIAAGIGLSAQEKDEPEIHLYLHHDISEDEIIVATLTHMARTLRNGDRIAGFNCFGFDVPFLYWRACVHGIDHNLIRQAGITFHGKWGLQSHANMFDLMTIAKSRPRRGPMTDMGYDKLTNVAKSLGMPGKDVEGDKFASMNENDQREYLSGDVRLTHGVAKRILPFW